MAEFCDKDFEVLVASGEETFEGFKLSELLPFSFDEKNLSNGE
jgi:cytidine deaminase